MTKEEQNQITEKINNYILENKRKGFSTKNISDEWHTFEELYFHRMVLFYTIMKANKEKSWKAKLHHDGTMFEDSFVVGIETPEGQISYHYHAKYWDFFEGIKELHFAPQYDGHTPDDIVRLLSL